MTSPCGCGDDDQAGECFCVMESSSTISVSGSGTSNSPYVHSLESGAVVTSIEGVDTDTVEMSVDESDGEYEVSADVVISDDSDNVLVQGSDGGLFVEDGTATAPPVMIHVFQTESQTLPAGSETVLDFDEDGSVITIPMAGVYVIAAFVGVEESVPTDELEIFLALEDDPDRRITGTGRSYVTDLISFSEGSEVLVVVENNSGSDVTTSTSWGATRFTLTRVSDSP